MSSKSPKSEPRPAAALTRRQLLSSGVALGGALLVPQTLLARGSRSIPLERTLADDDCGVASGDPRADSVVIWTRVPALFQPGGGAVVSVTWELATQPDFSTGTVVQSGSLSTGSSQDFTVKHKVSELQAGTTYYYRFATSTGYLSVTGRTRTAPAPGSHPSALSFAFISCESFVAGYYHVLQTLAQDEVDFCVMLGDAVYESNGSGVRIDDTSSAGRAETLEQWRAKWKLYLSDPWLREVRRLFPWIYIWDDHEVFNNIAGGDPTLTSSERSIQRNAYQVWREFVPADPDLPHGEINGIAYQQIYRKFAFGDLLEVFAVDGRQYRDPWPCGRDWATTGCDEVYTSSHGNLKPTQLEWLKEGLGASSCRWKVMLNQTVMMGLKLSNGARSLFDPLGLSLKEVYDGYFINGDQWDGYPGEREDLLSFVGNEGISNFMVVTGDIHNCYAGLLKPDFSSRRSPVVGVEVVGGSVSSDGIGEVTGPWDASSFVLNVLSPANPHLLYIDAVHHVYTRVDVTPEATYSTYIGVDTIVRPEFKVLPLQRFTIPDGVPTLIFGGA